MSLTSLSRAVLGNFNTNIGNSDFTEANVEQSVRTRQVTYIKAVADAMASSTETVYFFTAPVACTVTSIKIQPSSTITADATDYVTVTVNKGDGAAGSLVAIGTLASDLAGGSWATGVTKSVTLTTTIADRRVPAGSTLAWKVAKAGSGKAVPISAVTVTYTED